MMCFYYGIKKKEGTLNRMTLIGQCFCHHKLYVTNHIINFPALSYKFTECLLHTNKKVTHPPFRTLKSHWRDNLIIV